MEYKRKERLGDLIKEVISEMIMKKVKDPRIGFITITDVEMTDDLRLARVFFSVMGGDREKKDSFLGLESATGFIKKELGLKLRLKYAPDIVFEYDDSLEYGSRIDRIIENLRKDRKGGRC
jgi:ribosome-binding factor A